MDLAFGDGLRARELPFAEFHDLVAADFRRVFGRPLLAAGYPVRLILARDRHALGWHFGTPLSADAYEMTNTGILPEFRRQGIYTAFTAALMRRLREEGVRRIVSRHRPENLAVLDAKRKLGFVEAGTVEDHRFGRLLRLETRL